MSYKHKYYKPLDSVKGLVEDYPILEPCYTLLVGSGMAQESFFYEKLNELVGEEKYSVGDEINNKMVNDLLDILEDKGLIHNE